VYRYTVDTCAQEWVEKTWQGEKVASLDAFPTTTGEMDEKPQDDRSPGTGLNWPYRYHETAMQITMPQPTATLFIYLLTIHSPHPNMAQQPLGGQGLHNIEASRSHSDTPHWVRPLWTSDRPVTETST
jgi:hypothetical protein